jgi:hypothetical protein
MFMMIIIYLGIYAGVHASNRPAPPNLGAYESSLSTVSINSTIAKRRGRITISNACMLATRIPVR